jgi:hypothetical protein
MFFDFWNINFGFDNKSKELTTQEQLDQLRINYNNTVATLTTLKSQLEQLSEFNGRGNNTECDVMDLMQWANYVSKVSHKLLAPNEYPTYSYMIEPIKDEFGSIIDNNPYSSAHQSSVANPNVLLYIDRNGNIYIDGILENNSTIIGNRLKELASQYLDSKPVNTIDDINL